MKLPFISFILSLLISVSFISIKPRDRLIADDCQTVVDSAKVFLQTSEFAINAKPTIKDHERNLRLDKWFQNLSFETLTCLLKNKSISLEALGFMYAANFHSDSLLKNYSYLLSDTTTVQFFMLDGSTSPKMKLGELLSTMTQKIKEDKDNFDKRPEIESIVSKFIRQYATYPNTYKPISFPYFSMGSDNKGILNFNIRHEYEIKNNEGKRDRFVCAFVLDKNLRINVIEKDSSSYISSYPPKMEYWFKEFGRKLNKDDSLTLKLR
jgi:hypothetical protein